MNPLLGTISMNNQYKNWRVINEIKDEREVFPMFS
jgi:hypothetical protein